MSISGGLHRAIDRIKKSWGRSPANIFQKSKTVEEPCPKSRGHHLFFGKNGGIGANIKSPSTPHI